MSQPIGQMNIVLSANAATFSEAIAQAQKQLDKLSQTSRSAGHSTISSMQAASAAIREMNGDFANNVRAVERFATMLPGVGDALKMAFPLVGGVAFAAMFAELGAKIRAFRKEMEELPRTIQDSFRALHTSTLLTNDELHRTADELRNSIAVLEGHHENELAIELDDSRIQADKLVKSLQEAQKRTKELLAANNIQGFKALFTMQGETGEVADSVNSFRQQIADLGYDLNAAKHGGDKGAIDAAQRALDEKIKAYGRWLDLQISTRTSTVDIPYGGKANYASVYGDQSANLNILRGERTDLRDSADTSTSQKTVEELQIRQKAIEDRKKLVEEGATAQRKAAEAQMKAFEDGMAQMKAAEDVSTVQEYQYWNGLLSSAQKYPDNLRKVMEKVGQLNQQMGREMEASLGKYIADHRRAVEAMKKIDEELIAADNKLARAQHQSDDASAQTAATNAKNAAAMAELQIRYREATGAIGKYDAAVQMAQHHAAAYSAQLAAIRLEQQHDDEDTSLSEEERDARKRDRENKAAEVQGAAARTAFEDQQAIDQETALAGATRAMQEFAAAAADASARMKELVTQTLGTLNKTIIDDITGSRQRGEWKGVGHSLATDVAGAALKKGEGSLLSAFGLGSKAGPKGTAADPFHVVGPGMVPAGSYGGSSGVSNFVTKVLQLGIPGFAGGVDDFVGGLAMVGEEGPELLNLPRGSSVIPNGEIGGGGEVHHHHYYNIDARGSSDPAMVDARVRAGLLEAAPHLVAATRKSIVSENARLRPGARKY